MFSLKDREWRYFTVGEIFDIISGKDVIPLIDNGDIPYINSSGVNNGVTNFIKDGIVSVENVITIARTGTVGAAFYQPNFSYISGNIRALRLKNGQLNRSKAQFFITIFGQAIRDKYNYAKILGTSRIKRQIVTLPINDSGSPDWQFMEGYIHEREQLQMRITS